MDEGDTMSGMSKEKTALYVGLAATALGTAACFQAAGEQKSDAQIFRSVKDSVTLTLPPTQTPEMKLKSPSESNADIATKWAAIEATQTALEDQFSTLTPLAPAASDAQKSTNTEIPATSTATATSTETPRPTPTGEVNLETPTPSELLSKNEIKSYMYLKFGIDVQKDETDSLHGLGGFFVTSDMYKNLEKIQGIANETAAHVAPENTSEIVKTILDGSPLLEMVMLSNEDQKDPVNLGLNNSEFNPFTPETARLGFNQIIDTRKEALAREGIEPFSSFASKQLNGDVVFKDAELFSNKAGTVPAIFEESKDGLLRSEFVELNGYQELAASKLLVYVSALKVADSAHSMSEEELWNMAKELAMMDLGRQFEFSKSSDFGISAETVEDGNTTMKEIVRMPLPVETCEIQKPPAKQLDEPEFQKPLMALRVPVKFPKNADGSARVSEELYGTHDGNHEYSAFTVLDFEAIKDGLLTAEDVAVQVQGLSIALRDRGQDGIPKFFENSPKPTEPMEVVKIPWNCGVGAEAVYTPTPQPQPEIVAPGQVIVDTPSPGETPVTEQPTVEPSSTDVENNNQNHPTPTPNIDATAVPQPTVAPTLATNGSESTLSAPPVEPSAAPTADVYNPNII